VTILTQELPKLKLEYGITLHGPTPLAMVYRPSMLMEPLSLLAVVATLVPMVATESKPFWLELPVTRDHSREILMM
jgi:hypothetical protein